MSFYVLMLSIFLLLQKNSDKIENLLLLGYAPTRVARPYRLLTLGLNGAVLALCCAGMACSASLTCHRWRRCRGYRPGHGDHAAVRHRTCVVAFAAQRPGDPPQDRRPDEAAEDG
ncbi:MAG: hypothetical protein ACLVK4_12490 [Alistipes shahii]|uniref:hypothetical protein n=1 Tax=Alistipes shahii TaxID=328814 RepID=UPI00399C5108